MQYRIEDVLRMPVYRFWALWDTVTIDESAVTPRGAVEQATALLDEARAKQRRLGLRPPPLAGEDPEAH